jgi:chromosome segregation ATPase
MVLVVAGLMLPACSSGDKKTAGEERSASAVTGLKETRAELVAGRNQVDKTVASMNAMRDSQGSLQTEFAAFNNEIKNMDARAEKARARAKDMKARASQYQAKWREEMGKVEDPTLRAAATARANKVRERYDGITAKANEARAAYDPFMKQLRSVQTYLSNDLTPQAVQSAASVFDKAVADAKTVNAKIDAVIAELDDVATSLTPAAAAPAAKK